MNLVIPMAGRGSRFSSVGYTQPKPLIPFLGKTMVEHVVDAFPYGAHKIFLVLKEHEDAYNVSAMIEDMWPGSDVVLIDGVTEGAACTVLCAKHLIDNDEPLAIMNSDNIIHWNPSYVDVLEVVDGLIMVFEDTNPKWSFAKVDKDGFVTEVVEKRPVSNLATAGLYFWAEGSMFVEAAEQMIAKNIRVNGEFYVAPVYTENVALGHKILTAPVTAMYGVGTPEDLQAYLEHVKK